MRLSLQWAQVDDIMWSMGLNPYDMYGPCFGGAPEKRVARIGGLLRESEDEIVLAYPADISLDEEEVREYEQVGAMHLLTHKDIHLF